MSPGVCELVNIAGLNSSVVRALAWYARGTGFEFRLRFDFSPPVTFMYTLLISTKFGFLAFVCLLCVFKDEDLISWKECGSSNLIKIRC